VPATTYPLTDLDILEAGATYVRDFTFLAPNGDPYDLTQFDPTETPGAVGFRAHFRLGVDDSGDPLVELGMAPTPTDEGFTILDATAGSVRMRIEAATLTTLSNGQNRAGVWDMESAAGPDDGAIIVRWLEGAWQVSPEVTRQ
jgi:hypothetical protein